MADLREVYELEIKGNFDQKLRELRDSIDGAQGQWKALAAEFEKQGAVFKRSKKYLSDNNIVLDDTAKKANKAAEKQLKLNDSTRTLARASNRLVAEQNRLNETYLAEATALDQLVKKAEPRIIQARAEALAMQKLTKHLVGVATHGSSSASRLRQASTFTRRPPRPLTRRPSPRSALPRPSRNWP